MKKSIRLLGVLFLSAMCVLGLASCASKEDKAAVENAMTKLTLAVDKKEDVIQSFDVNTKLVGDVEVSWTSSNEAVATIQDSEEANKKFVKIMRPATAEGNKSVTLTANLTKNEAKSKKEFTFTVLCVPEGTTAYPNIAAVKEAIKDVTSSKDAINVIVNDVVVVGILTGKGCMVADATGTMYLYGGQDQKVGDRVDITATAYRYYNCPQFASATITKTASNANVEIPTTAKTISQIVTGGIEDVNNFVYVKTSVKIKVLTKADGYEIDDGLLLCDPADESKFVMVYNYNEDAEYLLDLDGATIDLSFALHDSYNDFNFGGSLGKQTVIRVNYFEGKPDYELSDQQIIASIAREVAAQEIESTYFEAPKDPITLLAASTKYPTATISYELEEGATAATLAAGKLTIIVGEEEKTATLIATVTYKGLTETVEFNITTALPAPLPITLLANVASGASYTANNLLVTAIQVVSATETVIYLENADGSLKWTVAALPEGIEVGKVINITASKVELRENVKSLTDVTFTASTENGANIEKPIVLDWAKDQTKLNAITLDNLAGTYIEINNVTFKNQNITTENGYAYFDKTDDLKFRVGLYKQNVSVEEGYVYTIKGYFFRSQKKAVENDMILGMYATTIVKAHKNLLADLEVGATTYTANDLTVIANDTNNSYVYLTDGKGVVLINAYAESAEVKALTVGSVINITASKVALRNDAKNLTGVTFTASSAAAKTLKAVEIAYADLAAYADALPNEYLGTFVKITGAEFDKDYEADVASKYLKTADGQTVKVLLYKFKTAAVAVNTKYDITGFLGGVYRGAINTFAATVTPTPAAE